MNSSKAKQLRQSLREAGFDPKETVYSPAEPPQFGTFSIKDGKPVANPEGTVILKIKKGTPTKLENCGRKAYKQLKKVA